MPRMSQMVDWHFGPLSMCGCNNHMAVRLLHPVALFPDFSASGEGSLYPGELELKGDATIKWSAHTHFSWCILLLLNSHRASELGKAAGICRMECQDRDRWELEGCPEASQKRWCEHDSSWLRKGALVETA